MVVFKFENDHVMLQRNSMIFDTSRKNNLTLRVLGTQHDRFQFENTMSYLKTLRVRLFS